MGEMGVVETVLATGMTMVELPLAGRLATTIAVVFPAGARYEHEDEVGVAHLLEHLAFRGTENYRTAAQFNRAAEYLGTEIDGAATNDYVEFSTAVRAESALGALELLTELAARPLLEKTHLDAERAIVLQEIADANEHPGSRAGDRLSAALFHGHRLAKSTVGEATDVERVTHDQLLAFRDRQWSPQGGLVVIGGNLDSLDRSQLEQLLLGIPDRPAPPPAPAVLPFRRRVEVEERDGDVVHLRLAYAVAGVELNRRHDRAVTEVFSQLLGGPMGSRLFDELREQRALCYWIDGHVWGDRDAAYLSVDCSVGPQSLSEAYERIEAIVDDLRANGPTEEETARARAYASGAVALAFESSNSRVDHAIELIMEYGDHDVDPVLHLREIDSITRDELAELAGNVKPGPCIGCVGPVTEADFQ